METIAIIPAYNEEKTLGNVLVILEKAAYINKIIVVSDGSTDNTAAVARRYNVEVIELAENRGKGGALKAGLVNITADVVLFLDADLIGLTVEHVNSLLIPVLKNDADMTIGIFEKGRLATDLAQKMVPQLSGQRALKFSLLEQISGIDVARFGVEAALNRFMESSGAKVQEVALSNMSHVMKEEKLGVWKGMAARMKMYWEIIMYLSRSGSLGKTPDRRPNN